MLQVQRLNLDNTWWIHFHGCKILLDPWLKGYEIDFFSWFNKQKHRTAPVSVEEVPEHDVILISQKYPDHFHVETLKELDTKVIIAPKSVCKKLRKLFPQKEIHVLEELSFLPGTSIEVLFWDAQRKIDPIYDGIFLRKDGEHICLATHGFVHQELPAQDLGHCKWLLTPFNHYQLPFFLGGTVSPGLKGLEQCVLALNPQKISATHDEDKEAHGIVHQFAKIKWAPPFKVLNQFPFLENKLLLINDYQTYDL